MLRKETSEGRSLWSLTLLVLLAACGGEQGDTGSNGAEDEPMEARREGMEEADYGNLDPEDVGLHVTWATNLISYESTPDSEIARLTDVVISSHEGFDRTAFTFEPRIPGYRLQFTDAGGGCDGTGPGTESPAQLVVEFERATANDGGAPLIGDRDRALDHPTLSRAVQTCDEGDKVTWHLGTSGEAEYRLLEAYGYTVLVVDLRRRP